MSPFSKCTHGSKGKLMTTVSEKETKNIMIDYAKSFIGTPYLWGGESFGGFDCSGFVQEVLKCVGLDPKGDQTAQALYNYFSKKSLGSGIQKGSLLFFGKSLEKITHVAIAIDHYHMIEAGGGGINTINVSTAIKQKAMVRIRPIKNRNDIISAIKI